MAKMRIFIDLSRTGIFINSDIFHVSIIIKNKHIYVHPSHVHIKN